MSVLKYSAVACAALLSTTVSAKQYWSDTSFSALQGSNYELGDDDRNIYTFEHASGHSWGSLFTFVDRAHNTNFGDDDTYGELGFSFDVYNNQDGFVKKAYVTPQWEFGRSLSGTFNNFLAGVGVDLAIPGASYFNVNLYQRNNEQDDNNQQLTLVWSFPFADSFVYDGFLDAINGSDTQTGGYNFTSQLKYDVGQHIGVEKSKLYLGIEYVYWKNKFGVSGVDEKNANLLIKWHL
ncbi:MAG: nucleoside-binding protein [Gammaproteobacteria bacterium]|nr:nucleoside-binding protein [Gammaproteobacteria bacterium]